MRILVESLKRLFFSGKISKDRLDEMATEGKITADEWNYIIKEETDSILQEKTDTILKKEMGEGEKIER